MSNFSAEYAIYALLARPDRYRRVKRSAWLASWVWIPFIGFLVFLLLLFPNGRLPSRRWRWLAWLTVLLTSVGTVWLAFSPGAIDSLGPIRNPLGIEGLPDVYSRCKRHAHSVIRPVASSLIVRLRRARG